MAASTTALPPKLFRFDPNLCTIHDCVPFISILLISSEIEVKTVKPFLDEEED